MNLILVMVSVLKFCHVGLGLGLERILPVDIADLGVIHRYYIITLLHVVFSGVVPIYLFIYLLYCLCTR